MDGQGTQSGAAGAILRRKVTASAGEGVRLTPERAMRIAFGRAASDFPAPGLRLVGFSSERSGLAELAAAATEGGMAVLLSRDGLPGGAALADFGLVSALVEVETTGRLSPVPPAPRPVTRLDRLLVARRLDAALAAFDEVGAGLPIADTACGWRLGELLASPASLPLVLEEAPLRLMRLAFEMGPREGRLWLATPLAPARPAAAAQAPPPRLQETVLAARAQVRAVLTRLELPLDEVTAWQPGTLLPIDRAALTEVRLEDIAGTLLARGRLGQMSGTRAVRLDPGEGVGVE